MPTLAQIRDAVDAKLAEWWPTVTDRQAAYLAAKGRYWQGIRVISGDPPEDMAAVPCNAAAKPTDQAEDWTAFGLALPATLGFVLRIDVYDGPAGKGYVATVEAKKNGVIYERARNVGPEAFRTFAWRQKGAAA